MGKSILTEAQVKEILTRLGGETTHALATEYGVSQSAISQIKRGSGWKHVQRPHGYAPPARPDRGTANYGAKLKEADVRAIRLSGETDRVLSARYGVAPGNIWSIRNRRSWKHLAIDSVN